MSDNNSNSTDSIDIEDIADGDVLHLENKHGEEEEVLEVEHVGHAMVWLVNDQRLFYRDGGEKWTYEGTPARVEFSSAATSREQAFAAAREIHTALHDGARPERAVDKAIDAVEDDNEADVLDTERVNSSSWRVEWGHSWETALTMDRTGNCWTVKVIVDAETVASADHNDDPAPTQLAGELPADSR
ncbi:hypothetical protein [Halostella salina]|uniref:hypothetical protein n=1 Tax=Halostella salina TaxID=1547897 RepID=UPI000EF7F0DC|nr:hypothetical protein [Halostella salina]